MPLRKCSQKIIILGLIMSLLGNVEADTLPSGDFIALPPSSRAVKSRNGAYHFRVHTTDNWRSPFPLGTLSTSSANGQNVWWQRRLPQHYGPRFMVVTPSGDVVLLDSWLNGKPVHAVSVLNNRNGSLVNFSYEDVLRSLGLSSAMLAERARFGSWWITAKPSLDWSGNLVLIPAGGKTLVVNAMKATINVKP